MARIETADDLAVGTGFLVAGPDLHQDLPPLVVVTNGHVVPEDLDPADAWWCSTASTTIRASRPASG